MFEGLDEKFDVEHEPPSMEAEPESVELEVYVASEKSAVDIDTDLARSTLHRLLQKGEETVDEARRIARDSEHPRAYEVAGTLIKQISEVARDLMEVQKAKKVLDKPTEGAKSTIKTQNIFVGSTRDLLKKIREEAVTATAKVIE
jgi:hypothetical protein